MNKEKQPGFTRRVETTAEKVGGGVIAALGLIALELPAVALGIALYIVGRARTPKTQRA